MQINYRYSIFTLALTCALAGCQEPASPASAARAPASQGSEAVTPATQPQAEVAQAGTVLSKLDNTESTVELNPSSFCNLEYLGEQVFNGQPLAAGAGPVELSGWVGDEVLRDAPKDPVLRFEAADNKSQVWEAPIKLGVKREDVVANVKEPKVVDAGFSDKISVVGLPAGSYHLYLSYQSQGARYACDNGRHVNIGG